MFTRLRVFAILLCIAAVGFAARKPTVIRPSRPASEAAADFYPEIEKVVELHQRWAARAVGAGLDSCRRHYRQSILDAFGHYSIQRRREFMQTRWPRTYAMLCRGKQGKVNTCMKTFAAPLGQEFDTAGLRIIGRPLPHPPKPSENRRHLEVSVMKRGTGTSRTRVIVSTRRTVEDIERELDRELADIREKLERHSLPSDKTLEKYPL